MNATASSSRTVLVTGATSDIGRAVCHTYARAGWNLVAHYNRDEDAQFFTSLAKRYDVTCQILRADFRHGEQLEAFIMRVTETPLQALVNNAGGYASQRHYVDLDRGEVEATLAVNLVAPMLLVSRLFPAMAQQGFGRIVNISSVAAKYGGSAQSVPYGCAKRGLEALARTFSREGAKHNVLVNNIRPGVIDTRHYHSFPKDMQARVSLIPAQRMGTPAEVAEAVLFLGSERNTFITGATLPVSGGE